MEKKTSIELLKTNYEYLQLKRNYDNLLVKKNALKNIITYLKKRNFAYLFMRIMDEFGRSSSIESNEIKNLYKLKGDYCNLDNDKIVIYTVITGDYDTIYEPLYMNENIDYVCFTDRDIESETGWKIIRLDKMDLPYNSLTNKEKSRLPKILPHIFFPEYKYSVYIDGNVRIMADMYPIIEELGDHVIAIHRHSGRNCIYKEAIAIKALKKGNYNKVETQVNRYKENGFPPNFGLFQCSIIAREHNHESCISIMNEWWKEYYETESKRDQMSFPYAVWKSGFDTKRIYSLGNDWLMNPRFRVYQHRKS